MSKKLDLKKSLSHLYQPGSKEAHIVEVPEMKFLMIDGSGDPNTSASYQHAVQALYGVAYALKFMAKKELSRDYVVMPLEGLWWGTPLRKTTFTPEDKAQFQWRMMILQPEFITELMIDRAIVDVNQKKNLAGLEQMRFESFEEGLCVQVFYVGPYDDEGPTIQRMNQFAFDQGYQLRGKHHEIYLSNPQRTDPTRLKTILRHPIENEALDAPGESRDKSNKRSKMLENWFRILV